MACMANTCIYSHVQLFSLASLCTSKRHVDHDLYIILTLDDFCSRCSNLTSIYIVKS